MSGGIRRKWRPPLLLVLGGSLLAVLVLPVLGVFLVDALAPEISVRRALLAVGIGALSVTLVLGWLLWRLILKPVRALSERAEAVREGAAATPLDHYGTPEISELGQVVLDMARVLQAREMAVRSYADHVSHELKTPLSAIRGAAELLEGDDSLSVEARALVKTIATAERRSERLLEAARDIAAAREPLHRGRTTLGEVSGQLLAPRVLTLRFEGSDVPLPISGQGLAILLNHLVENAEAAGATTLTVVAQAAANPRLTVSDDGPGISPGNRDRIFDPFFTTGRESGGTGMGLAIVQTMLLAHGAEIVLAPDSPGATFEIRF